MAKVKNFKDEKETITIAKTPGHRKNRKVVESLPFDWKLQDFQHLEDLNSFLAHSAGKLWLAQVGQISVVKELSRNL